MAHFVGLHLRHHGAAALIGRGQALEVFAQVVLDLAFGLHDEAEADPVADQAGAGADREGAGTG